MRRRGALMVPLPEELLACCASFLDTPSAGRFAAASRQGQRLVLARLAAEKAERDRAEAEAAAAAADAQAAPRRRIEINALGTAFIDAYVNIFIGAGLAARGLLVEQILAQAAGHEDLASANWTTSTVAARLKNAAKCAARAHNAAA